MDHGCASASVRCRDDRIWCWWVDVDDHELRRGAVTGRRGPLLPSGGVGFVRRHPVVSAVLVLFLLAAGTIVASAIAVWNAAHTDDARRIDHVDAIVVLGAAQYNGQPSPV